jgi:hypothetical protein
MAKKRRMPVLAGQIMLMLLGVLMFFVYFGVLQSASSLWYRGTSPGVFLIIGLVFLVAAMLLESVAFEKTVEGNTSTNMPYLPPPPQQSNVCTTCLKPLTFIQQYNAWFCFNCKKYGDSKK